MCFVLLFHVIPCCSLIAQACPKRHCWPDYKTKTEIRKRFAFALLQYVGWPLHCSLHWFGSHEVASCATQELYTTVATARLGNHDWGGFQFNKAHGRADTRFIRNGRMDIL